MARQIQVQDDTYRRLKAEADHHYRTIGGHIDWMLAQTANDAADEIAAEMIEAAQIIKNKKIAEASPVKDVFSAPIAKQLDIVEDFETLKRTPDMILTEINMYQAAVDNAELENQDPDYWAEVNTWKQKVKELWQEWHEVAGR